MREILPPAYRIILHSQSKGSPSSQDELTIPSILYDNLRATLVQAELLLLRVLGFELRLPLPLDYVPRYLHRALQPYLDVSDDYDSWSREEREEYCVLGHVRGTSLGKRCSEKAVEA